MNRFILVGVTVSVLVVAILLGWYQANTDGFSIPAGQNDWKEPVSPPSGETQVAELKKRLLQTGYFNKIDGQDTDQQDQENIIDTPLGAAEKKYGPFPHIISIARIDGVDTAQLRLEENVILTVRAGATIPSGWVIHSIYPDYLEADAGKERFSFEVFAHKNIQQQDAGDE